MTTNPDRDRLRLAFARTHADVAAEAMVPASSDAGLRSYWRIPGHGIVMDAPPADNDLAAWLRLRALLAAGGVHVPELLAQDLAAGFLLIEDLGTETLLDCIHPENAAGHLGEALAVLVRLQQIQPPREVPREDDAHLQRDLDLFDEWFLGRELGLALTPAERGVREAADAILRGAALAQPQVLVHRDYMVRNLMPGPRGLAVIDFQDAVIGPIAYDVVSLLRDAFISWPEEQVEGWLREYHDRAAAAGLPVPPWPAFQRDADLIGVHRHLKVLGVFSRLLHRDRKARYLPDAPRFIGYLDTVLPRHAELAGLHELLLQRVWPAWRKAHPE